MSMQSLPLQQTSTFGIVLEKVVAPNAATANSTVGFVNEAGTDLRVTRTYAGSAVPIAIPSTGTITTGGAITITGGLGATYTGGIWLWLPANTAGTGAATGAAGLYWTVMSSATAGQVYTNYVLPSNTTTFVPYVPTNPSGNPLLPAAALTTATGNNGAYATLTSEVQLAGLQIPANTLGPNGQIKVNLLASNKNSAGAKTINLKWGSGAAFNTAVTTSVEVEINDKITNRGATGFQVRRGETQYTIAAQPLYYTQDTGTALNYGIYGTLATATDYLVIEQFAIDIVSGF